MGEEWTTWKTPLSGGSIRGWLIWLRSMCEYSVGPLNPIRWTVAELLQLVPVPFGQSHSLFSNSSLIFSLPGNGKSNAGPKSPPNCFPSLHSMFGTEWRLGMHQNALRRLYGRNGRRTPNLFPSGRLHMPLVLCLVQEATLRLRH